MSRSLVTGAAGFVGQHLVAELLRCGDSVVGTFLDDLPSQLDTLIEEQARQVEWVQVDVRRVAQVRRLVDEHPVDRVFHLAAQSSVRQSRRDPGTAMSINAIGTLNVLDALHRSDAAPRVVISGSAEVYGAAATRTIPLTEGCPLEPLNPYAVSKAAQELLGLQYARIDALPVIVTRSFNHTGPGQKPPFVGPELALQIVEASQREARKGPALIRVGAPEVKRDFTDVRDVARAYRLLGDSGTPGSVYNVCSGRAVAIGEMLETLAEIAGVQISLELAPGRARAVDVPEMVGDPTRLREATGWQPQIELRQTLSELLDSLAG